MMAFELFKKDEPPIKVNKECTDMFKRLTPENYAVSDLKADLIRQQARLQEFRVYVTAHPKDTTYIVKLKPNETEKEG